MSILKYALIGAAVAYGIQYITKKREDGTSIADDFLDKATEWAGKGKEYATQVINNAEENIKR